MRFDNVTTGTYLRQPADAALFVISVDFSVLMDAKSDNLTSIKTSVLLSSRQLHVQS